MRHLRILVLLALLPLVCVQFSQASELIPSRLTLRDAVGLALDSHVNMKRAESSRLDALSRLKVANFQTTYGIGSLASVERNPQDNYISSRVFGSIRYTNLLGTVASLDLSPFGFGGERGAMGIQLRHPLIRGKGLFSDKYAEIFDAQTGVSIENKSYFQSQQSTVLRVTDAYFQAVLAREQVKVQEGAVANAQAAEDGARERLKWRLVAAIEVSRAGIRLAQTREELNQRKQSAKAALDALMLAIGAGVGQSPELIDSVPDVDAKQLPTLENAIRTALSGSPDLEIYRQQLASQQRRVQIAKDQLRSGLDVVAGFNTTSSSEGLLSASFLEAGSLRMGIEYNFPLDKRSLSEDRDVAERGLDVLQRQRAFQEEQIADQVRNAYRGVETARASLDILGQNVTVAEENLRFAQLRLDEGLDDNRNVLEAQAALTQAQLGLQSAKIDLYLARIRLRHAMGEDLTTPGAL